MNVNIFLLISIFLFAGKVKAEEKIEPSKNAIIESKGKHLLALDLFLGKAKISGDLSSSSESKMYGFALTAYFRRVSSQVVPYIGVFDSTTIYDVTASGNSFPFTENASLNISTLRMPTLGICYAAHSSVDICIGGGTGMVSVAEGKQNLQSYGAQMFEFVAPYMFDSGLRLGLKASYFEVQGRQNKTSTIFGTTGFGFIVGWGL